MEPIQAIPGNANSLIGARLPDDATDRHLLDDSEPEERNSNSTYQDLQWDRPVDHTSASLHQTARKIPPSHPKFLRQILGLNPFKTSYFALFRSLDDLQSRCILFLGIILAVAAGVPLPLIGVIFGKIINNFPPNEDDLRIRLIELMGIAVAFFVVTWGWSVCWGVVGERVTRKMREKLVERTLGMDQAYFDTVSPDLTNILTEKTQTIQLGTSEKVGLFISSISYFVTAFTVGFILNAKLTGVLFVSVIPTMTAIVICGTKYVSKFAKQASSFTEQATAVAESAFRGVQIVQAFGISERLAQNHINFLRKALRAGIKKGITGALMLGGVYFVAYAANALAFWYGDRLRQGSSEAGTIYAVVFLILDASFVVGQFGPFIQTFALAAAAGQSVSEILDHPTTKIDVYSEEGKVLQRADFRQDIKLQDITFVYPGRPTERVLEGVNLEIPAGKVTGLVGPSGSGKSTVSAILLRLYDPSRGKIKLGDDDLATANIKSLRENIALVTQSPVLFTGTILENIMLGLPEGEQITEVEAVARCAAAAADAHCDFLEHLPEGLYTQIGAGHHSQLSGGQKQRICLARALVGNPQVLILDEYTSALDATSEGVVLENLQRISAASGRTTIIIAHRLATVKNADRIIVMEHGAVAEMGSHEDLIKADGLYNELIKAQQFDKKRNASPSSSLASTANSSQNEISQPMKALASTSKPNTTIRHEAAKKRTGELIVRSLSMSRPEMVWIIIGLLASLVSGGVIIGEALIFGNLVQLLNDTSNSPQIAAKISFYCLLFFILAIVALVSRSCGGGAFGLVSENLVLRVRDVSFRTILTQDISWFSLPGHSHHNLMSKLNMDSGHISGLSGVILGTFFSIATSVIGGIILAHIIAWKIAIVLLAAVPIMVLAGFFRLRILAKAEERHQTAYNSAAAMASEACAAIQTVAALGRERYFFQKYRTAIQGPYQESLKISVLGNIMLAFSLSVTYFVYALAYWWGSKQVRSGAYSQRDFFIVLPALLFSAQSAGQLFSLAPEITRAKTAAQSVFALHDEKPSIIKLSDFTKKDDTNTVEDVAFSNDNINLAGKGELQFKDVSLHYETRPDVAALQNVSFTIRPGEYVAFVGRSGAGKSSTVHLIERFFDPTSGQVLVDGQDIRKGGVQSHRARLGLVEQEPDLFPGSVKFNIGLGAKPGVEVSEENIIAVSKECELHEFIMSLPEGYNTEVGAHGSKLSGGQRQRLALARSLIRNPEILLLDEATSQLDANTEQQIRKAIAAASKGRTTIMIAHRLASVQHADRIFVFESGTIVEEGKHDELVASGGIYSNMVAAQELSGS